MNGRIWVESEVGRGSQFHFIVRLRLAEEEPIEPVAPEPASLHGMRVLVVDDNATNRRILEEVLKSWKMAPATVSNAKDAMNILQQAQKAGNPLPARGYRRAHASHRRIHFLPNKSNRNRRSAAP